MKKFLYILLSVLGFSACGEAAICDGTTKDGGDSQEIPLMYGTPTIEFTVRGKVTDSEGVPIEGIVVSSDGTHGRDDFSVVTNKYGTFKTSKINWVSIHGPITFTDIDGEANGGDFATYEVEVEELPKTKVKEGDGAWYQGEYEVAADIKLNKK